MQPQRKHARNSIVSNAATRGRLHNNIIQWRKQAGTRAAVSKPTPVTKPLVSARLENLILGVVACLTIVIAVRSGLVAAGVDMIAHAVGVR